MISVQLTRAQEDYGFTVEDAYGNKVNLDTSPETGGKNFGVRPMQLLLMALGGCSAIDVISILKKQRQTVSDYKMVISGEREHDKEPSLWKFILVEFHLYGDIDKDKAERAAELAMNKYCSVAFTLSGSGTEIKWQVFIHN